MHGKPRRFAIRSRRQPLRLCRHTVSTFAIRWLRNAATNPGLLRLQLCEMFFAGLFDRPITDFAFSVVLRACGEIIESPRP